MNWQDFVLSAGAIIFIIALIPAVISREKPPAFTSFLNTAVLVSFVIVYSSLSYWFAAIANSIIALLWFIIGLQKLKQQKPHTGL